MFWDSQCSLHSEWIPKHTPVDMNRYVLTRYRVYRPAPQSSYLQVGEKFGSHQFFFGIFSPFLHHFFTTSKFCTKFDVRIPSLVYIHCTHFCSPCYTGLKLYQPLITTYLIDAPIFSLITGADSAGEGLENDVTK